MWRKYKLNYKNGKGDDTGNKCWRCVTQLRFARNWEGSCFWLEPPLTLTPWDGQSVSVGIMFSDFAIIEWVLLWVSQAFQRGSQAAFLRHRHNRAYPSGDWVIGGGQKECASSAQQRKYFQTKSLQRKANTTFVPGSCHLFFHYRTWAPWAPFSTFMQIYSFIFAGCLACVGWGLYCRLPAWSSGRQAGGQISRRADAANKTKLPILGWSWPPFSFLAIQGFWKHVTDPSLFNCSSSQCVLPIFQLSM